jgi:hypothetical protein
MAKYTVYLAAHADLTVDVEVPDDLDDDEARERAIEGALEDGPGSLCYQCSGYRQNWSLELGDFDVARNPDGTEIQPERQG